MQNSLVSIFLLFLCLPISASETNIQISQPQKNHAGQGHSIQLISPYSQVKKEAAFLAGIQIPIPEGWHSYWSFAGDFGQVPKIKWKPIEGVEIKALPFPAPQRKAFPLLKKPFYSFIYETELLIPFQVFIDENYKEEALSLFVDIEWAICKELCISKQAKAELNLKVASDSKINPLAKKVFDFWGPLFPKEMNLKSRFELKDKQQIISFSFDEEIHCLDMFPAGPMDFSSAPPALLHQGLRSCSFQVEKAPSNLSKISGLLLYSKEGKLHSSLFQSEQDESLSLFWFILLAFLGGLILNFMPCVLPIIFLKFYNTLSLKQLPSLKILTLNLSYAVGVIFSFLVLAFAIFISKQTGESLGWGFHLQSPVFVTVLSLLFTLMAFYLLNVVSFPALKVPLFFKDEKIFSHFLTGILSTTAASPCTVPFMASAVGFAFSRSYVEIFIIFFFLGLGLSFPYLVLSFFPKAIRYIPGPGRKTEILKKILSIPLFLTVIWLLSILYLQLSFKLFVFSLSAFPLLLLWIFLHKIIQKQTVRRVLSFVFAGLALFFFIGQKKLNRSLQKQEGIFLDSQKTPSQNLNWMAFDEESLLLDRQKGDKVFVAFGAEWCLTCKFNERVFNSEEFSALVKKNGIRLYYGDWTNPDPEITRFLESYNQQGVPFYIFFHGEEKLFIFPSLLFKDSFGQDLKRLSD